METMIVLTKQTNVEKVAISRCCLYLWGEKNLYLTKINLNCTKGLDVNDKTIKSLEENMRRISL